MKVVGFGDYLMHFSPLGNDRFMQTNLFELCFTGAEANVCTALSYWGVETEFVTKLPDHFLSQKGIFLKGLNIKTDNIPFCDERMGTYFLESGRSVRPSYVIYDRKDSAFTKSEFDDYNWNIILDGADILYLSGITPTLSENLLDCCVKMLSEARKRDIKVFFDINYRATLCSHERSKEIISALLPYITHLIGNEEHFKMIFGIYSEIGEDEPEERLKEVTKKIMDYTKIQNVAVTVRRTIYSDETVIYASYRQNEAFCMSPIKKVGIVDRTGSGDAFSAGLIYSYAEGYSTEDSVNFASASCAFKHALTKDINFASVGEIKNLIYAQRFDVRR